MENPADTRQESSIEIEREKLLKEVALDEKKGPGLTKKKQKRNSSNIYVVKYLTTEGTIVEHYQIKG